MNKLEMIKQLAEQHDIPLPHARRYVDWFFELMSEALAKGDRVEIRGLMTLYVKTYNGYRGRNPKTGEFVQVKGKKLPFFKPGIELKARINQAPGSK
ncbi:MAG: integration host factor subunit beta [Desulfobacteraceae bacterium]|nr:integration host factor subunit beta [Desulfobacteraceae bacterium]